MSEDNPLGAMFPRTFVVSLFPMAQHQYVDWIAWRVMEDLRAQDEYPLLQELFGWRRHEVSGYMDADHDRRDRMIALTLYGTCELPRNIAWTRRGPSIIGTVIKVIDGLK